MARINFPQTFEQQQKLHKSITDKHTADGGSSPLTAYIAQHSINIAADITARANAATAHDSFSLQSMQSENYRALRDLAFKPIFTRLKGQIQFLKSFFRDNPQALGDWGVVVDNQSKIVYPPDFAKQTILFNAFADRHEFLIIDPNTSPLTPYLTKHAIDLGDDRDAVTTAIAHHEDMGDAANESENQKAIRDNLWEPVVANMRGMINYLKQLNSDNPKALAAWGITVDDSPRPPKMRTTKLIQGETITINNATLGGIFTNTGTVNLQVYKGQTATGTPTIVVPGGELAIMKGWSIITIVNTSALEHGKFTVLTSDTTA